jgi:hypothetical protein
MPRGGGAVLKRTVTVFIVMSLIVPAVAYAPPAG